MDEWIYHIPSVHGEAGPGYEPGMECEFSRGSEKWSTSSPSWVASTTYRYRWPTAEPVEEVPDWIERRYRELMLGADPTSDSYRSGHADIVFRAVCAWIAAHQPKPEDPFERAVREMFERAGCPASDDEIAKWAEALREHMPALIAAKGDE